MTGTPLPRWPVIKLTTTHALQITPTAAVVIDLPIPIMNGVIPVRIGHSRGSANRGSCSRSFDDGRTLLVR
jgi:hypothetical protein